MVNIYFRACSSYTFKIYTVTPKYTVGQTLYRCDLARKGVLEKVTIAEVLLNPPSYPIVAIYKDTFNSLNRESDLCYETDAMTLYNQYQEAKQFLCDQRKLYKMCRGLVENL